jgi:hypothetical protein
MWGIVAHNLVIAAAFAGVLIFAPGDWKWGAFGLLLFMCVGVEYKHGGKNDR